MTKRAVSRRERERRRQRTVIIAVGSMIGLALLAILAGIAYDQLWVPSRPVAEAGSATLTRSQYWRERRLELARNVAQTLQLQRILGDQFASQLAGQVGSFDSQVAGIRNAEVDDQTVGQWVDRELIVQGAAGLGLSAGDGDVAQYLVTDLGRAFPAPSPPAITSTTTLTPTAVTTATVAATAAPESEPTASPAAAEASPTAAAESPTPTLEPTATQAPTLTPVPTLLPDEALSQQEQVIQRVYDAYIQEMQLTDPTARPQLTFDDFRAALHDQYLRQALTEKVQAQLVTADTFTASTEPTDIVVRHILVKSTVPISATATELEAEFARLKPEADAILAEVQGGADFATVAQERSGDGLTRDQGGELPSFNVSGETSVGTQIDPAIVQAALALEDGAIAPEPVRTPFGWHIIQLVRKTVPTVEEQLRDARTEAFDEWLIQQRQELGAERFPAQSPTPTLPPTADATTAPLPTAVLGGEPTATPTPEPTPTAVPTAGTVGPAAPATPTP